jgi:hypothetical protein
MSSLKTWGLIRFWIGHANQSGADGYRKLKEDVAFRKKVAEQVELASSFQPRIALLQPIAPKASCQQELRKAMKPMKLRRKNGSPG